MHVTSLVRTLKVASIPVIVVDAKYAIAHLIINAMHAKITGSKASLWHAEIHCCDMLKYIATRPHWVSKEIHCLLVDMPGSACAWLHIIVLMQL